MNGKMDKKLILGLVVIAALMIVSCKPTTECGNGVCSAEKGETSSTCPADCGSEQAGVAVSLSPASLEVNVGGNAALNVMVADAADLFGYQFDISYDPNVLQLSEIQPGTFLSDSGKERTFCLNYTATPGLIKNIACTKIGATGMKGSGLLNTISFKALASGNSDVKLSNVKLASSKGAAIQASLSDSKITIK
jgi:general secretion pathway protein D